MSATQWKEGDVVAYTPHGGSKQFREGTAIAEKDKSGRIVFRDTFWQLQMTELTAREVKTAWLLFNMHDYRPVYSEMEWQTHAPADRQHISHQHGLQNDWLVRKGASSNWLGQVEQASRDVEDSEREASLAAQKLLEARARLEELVKNRETPQSEAE